MLRRFLITLCSLALATAVFAQDASTDLDTRLKALEEKVAAMQKAAPALDLSEIQREIDVLSKEIESLKSGQQRHVAEADTESYGLGAAASKVYRAEQGVSFGGYGEFLYNNPQHGVATADALRAVLYTGYKFNNRVLFNSELEVEHASTESGGAVSLEFGYLDFLMKPQANVRAGLVLIPMGLINEQHEPTAFFGARRPDVERFIIPATWAEIGAGVFGDSGPFTYRGYVVTGLNSAHFTADEGIREGRQAGVEAGAEDLALTGRLDWHPIEGTIFGGSFYRGGSGQGAGYTGNVTLGELHADSKFRGLSLRGLVARGTVADSARISEQNDEAVGRAFGGWYAEAAYDLSSLVNRGPVSFTPYARYERLDTQRRVAFGFARDPENDRRIATFGVAIKPIAQTVIKTDWQAIKSRSGAKNNQFNLSLGYIF
jgi:hypothetical protein